MFSYSLLLLLSLGHRPLHADDLLVSQQMTRPLCVSSESEAFCLHLFHADDVNRNSVWVHVVPPLNVFLFLYYFLY